MVKPMKVLVTPGPKAPRDKSIVETPKDKEDLQVIIIPKWRQALTRALRTFIDAFVTLILAGSGVVLATDGTVDVAGAQITLPNFWAVCVGAASAAVPITIVSFLKNLSELLKEWDDPKWRA